MYEIKKQLKCVSPKLESSVPAEGITDMSQVQTMHYWACFSYLVDEHLNGNNSRVTGVSKKKKAGKNVPGRGQVEPGVSVEDPTTAFPCSRLNAGPEKEKKTMRDLFIAWARVEREVFAEPFQIGQSSHKLGTMM